MYHIPVLLDACLEGLNIRPDGIYVDLTMGGAGHSKAIFSKLTTGKLVAFDQDPDAAVNKVDNDRFIFINQNFRYLKNYLLLYNLMPVDGILADLGVSSHQIDRSTRGFSTRFDGALDMRMDQRMKVSAVQIVNEWSEEALANIIHEFGELPQAHRIAQRICEERKINLITTTHQLRETVAPLFPPHQLNKHLAKLFQAIRITVNDELETLKEMLVRSTEALKNGGRLVVISYNSLEDRLVKNFFRAGNMEGILEKDFFGNIHAPLHPITRKPLMPEAGELAENPRAKSARLRIAEKK
ncbi:MAG: 16S rRNA (cytosine(1402)-N(4))-methyltransferase RsmH [Bacteroidetes bacterium]|nr:16S rRNA (cytosine(1402)-N(4))-methyltransferase RsmH [Bacteroidota bacterium]